jgi:hypothetical protein
MVQSNGCLKRQALVHKHLVTKEMNASSFQYCLLRIWQITVLILYLTTRHFTNVFVVYLRPSKKRCHYTLQEANTTFIHILSVP